MRTHRLLRPPRRRLRVRVVAPSSPFPEARMARGVARLCEAGLDVEDTSRVLVEGHAYLNGSDEERGAALEAALASDADVVWLARGGYGLTRLLSSLTLPDGPLPLVVGFSDATALSAHLFAHGIASAHGPLITTVADEPPASFQHLMRVLSGHTAGLSLSGLCPPIGHGPTGAADGVLFSANLCVLTHLVGTRSLPSLDGALLVLEEVGERPYRIDRMLTQLTESGALAGVRAVVLGHLAGCEEPGGKDGAPRAEDVFAERLSALGIPLVRGAPVGHLAPNFALPNGVRAHLAWSDGEAALRIVEDLHEGSQPAGSSREEAREEQTE